MSKIQQYREKLKKLDEWDEYLLKESGLPGRRGNLELALAAAEEGSEESFRRWLRYTPNNAPVDSPYMMLAFCGALGLGRLLAEGKGEVLKTLRPLASDPRWRMREAVAMALQRWGDTDIDALLKEMEVWSRGNKFEQRAAAAALCEPRLLSSEKNASRVLDLLDEITCSINNAERNSEEFRVLRKGLAYCWSVAVAALPAKGKPMMEKWFSSKDKDIIWIMKENLKKNRLKKMDPEWVDQAAAELRFERPRSTG